MPGLQILSDHLNTPRKLTDDTGTVLWSWNSDAFGTTAPDQDVDGDGIKTVFHLRFPGQYFDFETKQHYNYFRDYEPGTGRYLESDPIGLDGGINTFGYVGGNPIIRFDNLGLRDFSGGYGIQYGLGGGEIGLIEQDCCRDGQVIKQFFEYHEAGIGIGASGKFASTNFGSKNKACTDPKPEPFRITILFFGITSSGIDVGLQFGFSGRFNLVKDVNFWYEVNLDESCCIEDEF